MAKFKAQIIRRYSVFISFLLSLLGFSTACDPTSNMMEYGVPSADFIIRGKVSNSATSNPIPNIKVQVKDSIFTIDSVYAKQDGSYEITRRLFPESQEITLKFEDDDGTANGEFQDKDTVVVFTNPHFTGGDGHWYEGKTETEFNISLDPK